MKKYKLFNEGLRSSFGNNYYAHIGINHAEDKNYNLCYATGEKILDYYQNHGFLICEVEPLNESEEIAATLSGRIGEYSCSSISIKEPQILYDKKTLKELDQYNGLDLVIPTSFICDIIFHGFEKINCGYKEDGSINYKTYDPYESFNYLIFEKNWIDKVNMEDVCDFCAEHGNYKFLKYINQTILNIDLTDSLIKTIDVDNNEIFNFILNSNKRYSSVIALKNSNSCSKQKFKLFLDIATNPVKALKDLNYYKKTENYRCCPERREYEVSKEK